MEKVVASIDSVIGKLPSVDQVEIIVQSLKKQGILDSVRGSRSKKVRRKRTSYKTKKAAWDFWKEKSIPSTIGSERPPKLRMSDKPKIQEYVEPTYIIRQRGKLFYMSQWRVVKKTLRVLHKEYNETNPDMKLSYGSFFAL